MRRDAPRAVVIVGASLAGLRTAEALRAQGFIGTLTIVGAEPHLPYDRPPLSKQVLTAQTEPPGIALPLPGALDARWLLGRPATGLDATARTVTLADGTLLKYDGLVLATGSAARAAPAALAEPPRGVFTLRGLDDALALRAELAPGRRLVVVGAGFLGGEVAAAARSRGLHVTLVEAAAQPLERAVGTVAGAYVAALHRAAGIGLRTRTTVTGFRAGADGRVTGVELSTGDAVPADVVLLALGSVPATGWLAGSGTAVGQGVHCDPSLRVLYPDGSVVEGVVAAGDVARVPQPLAGGARLALGHWTNAVEQGTTAAATLLAAGTPAPFTAVPSFWSDLHGARIRSVGLPAVADEARVVEHDLANRRLEVAYHRKGRLVGALTIGRTARLAAYRTALHAHREAAQEPASVA
ncbi:NAD(P)/FAD-dependent oxidoreductase [Streptomyces sp. SLBN-134]|uniref:NAD(P)/FAD-dependent oxidoreductase n=1 Tax=Streptomyces sp. SLBN-134 TaxID=2768456 RepID=UPI0011548BA1|nr:FAD-dependent oxidoreductase [Streptomyces sp. SLBN-134]TQL18150.1 NAD/ferredoxin-dependent reductase-like protein [Streptomyces sp. SLBN-134]